MEGERERKVEGEWRIEEEGKGKGDEERKGKASSTSRSPGSATGDEMSRLGGVEGLLHERSRRLTTVQTDLT